VFADAIRIKFVYISQRLNAEFTVVFLCVF